MTRTKLDLEREVADYVSVNFSPDDWDVEAIVDEIWARGYASVDDMDHDEFTDLLEKHQRYPQTRQPGQTGPTMTVKTFNINTTDGKRYGLVNANTGDVLHGATARFKTERGAIRYAARMCYELKQS